MKQLVEFITKSLVEKPDAVGVQEENGADGVVIKLKVASQDLGRIIGQKGQSIKAIRQLLTAAAVKTKTRVSLIVQE